MKTYEAMFLFDPSFAADAGNPEKEVARIMERADAQIVMNKKWEERKLAYEIKGRKRGSYWLTFFQADPERIGGIERDAKISECILRLLIQRADHMNEDSMNKAYTALSQPVSTPPGVVVAAKAATTPPAESKEASPAVSTESLPTTVTESAPEGQATGVATESADKPKEETDKE